MNTLKKNYIYNFLYQILILIIPLITVPYISRVLNTDGIGIYSYTYSIVYYFMIIAQLGINNHGNRSIAKVRENKDEMSKTFFSIYSIQIFMSLVMIVTYLLYILLFNPEYKLISYIQMLYIFSAMFDINWFFFGLEKFKVTITRNVVLKLLTLALIMIFVKNESDVWIYTLLMAGGTLLSQLVLLPFLFKEIKITKIQFQDIKQHIKPCLILFLPVIAVSIYRVMDKIMLGALSNISEVGLYEQSEKIISVPISLITALGTVMMPRISNLASKGDTEKIKLYIEKSINFMMFIAFPISFGLISISDEFVPLFLGEKFLNSIIIVKYLSITIVFMSFANVIRTEYLLPYEKDKIFIISIFMGAIINVIFNFIFIPKYHAIGATYGTIIAEFVVMFVQAFSVRKDLPINKYLKYCIPFLVKSLIMFGIIYLINFIQLSVIIKICLKIFIGVLTYFILNVKEIKKYVRKV